jgi:Tfp pilus assembly protein PilN
MTNVTEKPETTGRRFGGRAGKTTKNASPEARIVSDVATRSKRQKSGVFVVGGVPRVDLLPTEVLVDRRERATVRRAWFGVVLVAVLMALGIGAVSANALSADAKLTAARAQTDSLTKQQLSYSEVREVQSETALLQAAQQVGGSTEIDWSTYLANLQNSLPSGVTITGVTISSASPSEAYQQATGPLEGQRVGTITIDATSPTLPSVPAWLDSVKSLRGFVDANANSVTLDPASGKYTVDMTIHINEKAYDNKYAAKAN